MFALVAIPLLFAFALVVDCEIESGITFGEVPVAERIVMQSNTMKDRVRRSYECDKKKGTKEKKE